MLSHRFCSSPSGGLQESELSAIKASEEVVATSDMRHLKARIRELERVLDNKTLKTRFLKMLLRLLMKKQISRVLLLPMEDR